MLPDYYCPIIRGERPNLDARMAQISDWVPRLEGQLMVILDVDRVLDMTAAYPLAA